MEWQYCTSYSCWFFLFSKNDNNMILISNVNKDHELISFFHNEISVHAISMHQHEILLPFKKYSPSELKYFRDSFHGI